MLTNPDTPAAGLVGEDAVALNGGVPSLTSKEFADKWVNKFEGIKVADASGTTGAPAADTINVELPDGTIIEGVPAGITRTQLQARLQKAGLSLEAAPQAPTAAASNKEPPPVNYNTAEEGMQSLLSGATFGTNDEITSALGALGAYGYDQLFGEGEMALGDFYDEGLNIRRNKNDAFRKENPGTALGLEVAGGLAGGAGLAKGAATFAPKTAASLTTWAKANPMRATVAAGAASGGAYGFGTGEGGATDRVENAISDAGLGALGGYVGGKIINKGREIVSRPGVQSALAKLGERFGTLTDDVTSGAARSVDDIAARTDDVAVAAVDDSASALAGFADDAGDATFVNSLDKMTPEQSLRARTLREVGVKEPTVGMLDRTPKSWQFEQNTKGIQGIGEPIQQRYIDANIAIQNALDDVAKKTGGKATTSYEAGSTVVEAIQKKSKEMQKEVGKLYTSVRERFGDSIGMRPNQFMDAIDEVSDEAAGDTILNSVMRRLKRWEVVDSNGNLIDGTELSVSKAEELRKFINRLSDANDPSVKRIKGLLIDSLDNDVIDTANVDAFKQARDAARDKFTEFSRQSIVGKVNEGKIVPDDVVRKTIFGGKVNDLKKFKDSLLSGTDKQVERGVAALNDIRVQGLQEIIDKSLSPSGELSGSRFSKQLAKIGKERLEIIYDPETVMQLKTIEKALEYTTIPVPQSVVNYSGTAAANVNNYLSGLMQGSKIGGALEKTGEAMSKVPLVGALPGKFTAEGGEYLNKLATKQSVKNVTNPAEALRRLAAPQPGVGIAAGVGGGNLSSDAPKQRNALKVYIPPPNLSKEDREKQAKRYYENN